jgi:hypothetical protein
MELRMMNEFIQKDGASKTNRTTLISPPSSSTPLEREFNRHKSVFSDNGVNKRKKKKKLLITQYAENALAFIPEDHTERC